MKRQRLKLVILVVLAVLALLWLVNEKKKAGFETRPVEYEEYGDEF